MKLDRVYGNIYGRILSTRFEIALKGSTMGGSEKLVLIGERLGTSDVG